MVNTVGAIIFDVPLAMQAPVRASQTTTSQIQVSWTPLTASTDIRALSILSYDLQWDAGTSGATWTDLVGFGTESTQTSFIAVTNITPGSLYQFQVRAKNLYGWGPFSPVATIRAS